MNLAELSLKIDQFWGVNQKYVECKPYALRTPEKRWISQGRLIQLIIHCQGKEDIHRNRKNDREV